MTGIAELIERLENEDLFPDDDDYYMPIIKPNEMALILAALRLAEKRDRRPPRPAGRRRG